MGCGKSKHAIVEATTVVKTMRSDGGTETRTTKTVTEKGDSAVVRQVETKSLVVEDSKKETVTTKIDPTGASKTENTAPASGDGVGNATAKASNEDEKAKDSNTTDANNASTGNVIPTSNRADVGPTKDDEVVQDNKPTNTNDVNNDDGGGVTTVVKESDPNEGSKAKPEDLVPASSKDDGIKTDIKDEEKKESDINKNEAKTEKVVPESSIDDVGATTVVKEDEEKKEFDLTENIEAKTKNVDPASSKDDGITTVVKEDGEKNETNQTEESQDEGAKTKTVAPTTNEGVVEAIEAVKVDAEFKDVADEKFVTPMTGSSNPKIEELKDVAPAKESTIAETKNEEDVKATEANIANATTSAAVEPEKLTAADEANAVKTIEKEP